MKHCLPIQNAERFIHQVLNIIIVLSVQIGFVRYRLMIFTIIIIIIIVKTRYKN